MKKTRLSFLFKFFVFAVCAVFLTASCGKGKQAGAGGKQGKEGASVFAVYAGEVLKGPIADYIALAGDIVAGSTVDTYSDAAGKITRVYVQVGQRVTRGQAVAAVDPSKPGMSYVEHIVHAPISGLVISVPGEIGMTISQSVPLVKISGGGALEIRLYVPERNVSKVSLGLKCEITLDAYPGETFRGTVNEVSPALDPVSRTMQIKVNVDNASSKLKAGMFAKVKIITESKNSVVKIPYDAIIQRGGRDVVFVVETDPSDPMFTIAEERQIVTGIVVDGEAEIIDGLEGGEEIVTKGMTLLNDGTRVNVINTDLNDRTESEGEGDAQ